MSAPDGAEKAKIGYRTLLRNRDYRLLYIGLAISMSGSWAYNVALVVFVFNATHSPAWVAAASMTRFLCALVASPFGGLIADRVERVRLMVTLDSVALILQAALAVVAALNGAVVLAIILAAARSISPPRTVRSPPSRTSPSSSVPRSPGRCSSSARRQSSSR